MEIDNGIYCSSCQADLGELATGVPCPECGSTARTITVTILEELTAYEAWSTQRRNPDLKSADKVRQRDFLGYEMSRRLGRMVHKVRSIDRDADRYLETVTDPISGEVIHHCEEPLSQHTGHGSAKSRPDKDS